MNQPANKEKISESVQVRGIAASIQAMNLPTFTNLKDLVENFGYTLVKAMPHKGE